MQTDDAGGIIAVGLTSGDSIGIEAQSDGADGTAPATLGADAPLEDMVRAHVRAVWERHGKNASEAARILGISRNTLRAKLG